MTYPQTWNPWSPGPLSNDCISSNAPAGGGGCGFFAQSGPTSGLTPPDGLPHVYSPAAKHVDQISTNHKKIDPNIDLVASDNCILFIASFEALGFICPDGVIRAYQDTKKKWTVGIGEHSGRDQNSTFASEKEALASFKQRVRGEFSKKVRDNLKEARVLRRLKQYEFDALVDAAYQHGNCLKIAFYIAHNNKITLEMFKKITPGEFEDRRSFEFSLFSGDTITVHGYSRFYRLDNTNGGYHKIGGKSGYRIESSQENYELSYINYNLWIWDSPALISA